MRPHIWPWAVPFLVLFMSPALASAVDLTATFADGKGYYKTKEGHTNGLVTDVVDAFTGMAGNGWPDAWHYEDADSSVSINSIVRGLGDTDYSELVDDNNMYVQTTSTSSGQRMGGVWRDYGGGVDPTKEHTIQFTVRIEEDPFDTEKNRFQDTWDCYSIHDRVDYDYVSTSGSTISNVLYLNSGYSTWGIRARGSTKNWCIHGGSFTDVDTGITIAQYTPYTFTIDFDPAAGANGTFDVEISSEGTSLFSGSGYRMSDAPQDENGLHIRQTTGRLLFSQSCIRDSGDGQNYRKWTIDGITITGTAPGPSIPGDTNNDSIVDSTDAAVLAANWGGTTGLGDYTRGDFNGDGIVNVLDASILAANWGDYNEVQGEQAVPEPSAFILLTGCLLAIFVRRTR